MNWKLLFAGIGIAGLSLARGAVVAPANLTDCVVTLTQSSVDVFTTDAIWLRSDGTYQELSDFRWVSTKVTNLPLESGTYQYSLDPGASDHAVRTFYPAGGATHQANLYFTSVTAGSQHIGLNSPFTVSPRQTANGATNVSNLAWVTPQHPATTGFVIDSPASRWVLIRVVGPGLQPFGVTPVISAPTITLYRGSVAMGTYGAWSADPNPMSGLKAAFGLVGAFPLGDNSSDGATLVSLAPGPYSVTCAGGSDQGSVLCEVYILPY